MIREKHVVVIGSGFGGTITARILNELGCSVTLVDARRHPRFSIGESSTPIADQLLRLIGSRYGFDDLVSMSCYGRWKAAPLEMACGMKRGFSYFDHRSRSDLSNPSFLTGAKQNGRKGELIERFEGERSLLVAASPSDAASDTHWFRQEVDQALVAAACREGVEVREETPVTALSPRVDGRFEVTLIGGTGVVADHVIDASGNATTASLLARSGITSRLETKTKTAYSHFAGVESFADCFDSVHGDHRASQPFDADHAAQHHIIDEGWVWMLRLENGVTSVGVTSADRSVSVDQLVTLLQERFTPYDQLASIMRRARLKEIPGRILASSRIQKLYHPVLNDRCVMIPTAACTLDPLHSTGIAHALSGAMRLGEWFENGCRKKSLLEYGDAVVTEALHLDQMVSMAYRTMDSFQLFCASCMVYFAAAIACEERLMRGELPRGYWQADDPDFRVAVSECGHYLDRESNRGMSEQERIERVRQVLGPWNSAGLFESPNNRYAYTATKVS